MFPSWRRPVECYMRMTIKRASAVEQDEPRRRRRSSSSLSDDDFCITHCVSWQRQWLMCVVLTCRSSPNRETNLIHFFPSSLESCFTHFCSCCCCSFFPPPSIWFDFPLSLSLHLLLCKKWEDTITNRRPVGGWEKEIFCFSALTVRYFSLFRRATRAQLYTSVLLPPLLLQCPAKNK